MDRKPVGVISMPGPPCWKVYIDGAANQKGSEVGLVLVSPKKTIIEKSLRLGFSTTNNESSMRPCYKEWTWCRKWKEMQ